MKFQNHSFIFFFERTDKRTNGQTDKPKAICSPHFQNWGHNNMSRVMRKAIEARIFSYAKTKTHFSCAPLFFLVQPFYFLNPKLQASSHILWLFSPVCVGPGLKSRKQVFSRRGSYDN